MTGRESFYYGDSWPGGYGFGGYGYDLVLTVSAVPESSTAASLALGFSALWLVVRRRRNS